MLIVLVLNSIYAIIIQLRCIYLSVSLTMLISLKLTNIFNPSSLFTFIKSWSSIYQNISLSILALRIQNAISTSLVQLIQTKLGSSLGSSINSNIFLSILAALLDLTTTNANSVQLNDSKLASSMNLKISLSILAALLDLTTTNANSFQLNNSKLGIKYLSKHISFTRLDRY